MNASLPGLETDMPTSMAPSMAIITDVRRSTSCPGSRIVPVSRLGTERSVRWWLDAALRYHVDPSARRAKAG